MLGMPDGAHLLTLCGDDLQRHMAINHPSLERRSICNLGMRGLFPRGQILTPDWLRWQYHQLTTRTPW